MSELVISELNQCKDARCRDVGTEPVYGRALS